MKNVFARTFAALGALALVAGAVWLLVPPPRPASAQFAEQGSYGGVSGGSANAQTITVANLSNNPVGVMIRFVPGAGLTNTGPTQINVSGIGLTNVLRPSSIGLVAFSGGEFQAGEETCVTYNPVASAYQLACNVDMTTIGRTIDFRGSATPRGALLEDGSCVSQTTYAALFSVISTNYGSCAAGLFKLPRSNGEAFVALDNQGANGPANRITFAGSGCDATTIGDCGLQAYTLHPTELPTITSPVTVVASTGSPNFPNNISTSTVVQPVVASGSTAYVPSWGNSSGGVSDANAMVGTASSNNTNAGSTGVAHPLLNPLSLGRRAIKY